MLLGEGLSALEIARATGIPRSTVRDWADGRMPQRPDDSECPGGHLRSLNGPACLRITLDAIHHRADEHRRSGGGANEP